MPPTKPTFIQQSPDSLSQLLARRKDSLWTDESKAQQEIQERVKGATFLIPGGAGSIGSAFVLALIPFRPGKIVVIDPDENSLAHLVREVRNRFYPEDIPEFETLSLGIGTSLFSDWLSKQKPFDYVFSFAAHKHVRAERDTWSALAMLECNVLAHADLFQQCANSHLFSVSTDKAANPANLMGASKRLMERFLFSTQSNYSKHSARFANVLFSAGSLTESFWVRYLKSQIFACPREVRRFVMTKEESARLCLIAGVIPDSGIYFPPLNPSQDLVLLSDLLEEFMKALNLEPIHFTDEKEALEYSFQRKPSDPWPVLWTQNDTPGEKNFEEFYDKNEESKTSRLALLQYIDPPQSFTQEEQQRILSLIREWLIHPPAGGLDEIKNQIQFWIPEYQPINGISSLDTKI